VCRLSCGLQFSVVFGFDEILEIRKRGAPELAVLLDPGIDSTQRLRIEVVNAIAAFAVLAHEVCPTEQAQMFRDGWARYGKRLGNFAGRLATVPEQVEDSSPGGVGQSLKRGFVGFARRTRRRNT